jgi:hypothetical protein
MISARNSGKEFAACYQGTPKLHFPSYIYRVDFPCRPHSPYGLGPRKLEGVTIILEHSQKLRTSFSALFSGSGKNKTSIEEYVNLRFTCTLYDAHWWRRLSRVWCAEMVSASPRACMCGPLDIRSLKLLPRLLVSASPNTKHCLHTAQYLVR